MLGAIDVRLEVAAADAGEGEHFGLLLISDFYAAEESEFGFARYPTADARAIVVGIQDESLFHLAAAFAAGRRLDGGGRGGVDGFSQIHEGIIARGWVGCKGSRS